MPETHDFDLLPIDKTSNRHYNEYTFRADYVALRLL